MRTSYHLTLKTETTEEEWRLHDDDHDTALAVCRAFDGIEASPGTADEVPSSLRRIPVRRSREDARVVE